MEDRIVVAAAISFVTLAVFGWFALRKFAERRRFKLRQTGRGKSGEAAQAD